MKLDKLKEKLNGMFSAETAELAESHENLANIIARLRDKKQSIKEKMQLAGEQDETSEAYRNLEKEYKVACKLLKKAKKNYQKNAPDGPVDITEDS